MAAHRRRSLNPDHPFIRGTAQNPDVYFQMREAANRYYQRVPEVVAAAMARFAARTGRRYGLFEYTGAPDAERVIVLMGSGAGAAGEAVDHLVARHERVGLLQVRLFRPFSPSHLLAALPASVRAIAVLDRTKEPGATGEPLYLDVVAALAERAAAGGPPAPRVVGGRYGLSSKEFTPAMAKAVFDELSAATPRNHFTVGITDDVSGTSLAVDRSFTTESDRVFRAVFFGLGSDGTVGANKNSIKIIGDDPAVHVQAYFVYDSKKSGSQTVSHLRFGPDPIRSTYLVELGAVHRLPPVRVHREARPAGHRGRGRHAAAQLPVRAGRGVGPAAANRAGRHHREGPEGVDDRRRPRGRRRRPWLARQHGVADLLLRGLGRAAARTGHRQDQDLDQEDLPRQGRGGGAQELRGGRQHAGGPRRSAGARHRHRHAPAAADRGRWRAGVRPRRRGGDARRPRRRPAGQRVPGGRHLPERHLAVGEARHLGHRAGVGCEHLHPMRELLVRVSARRDSRQGLRRDAPATSAPAGFASAPIDARGFPDTRYTLQVYEEDCTGCGLCVEVCPVKHPSVSGRRAINMTARDADLEPVRARTAFFETLPLTERGHVDFSTVRGTQLLEPLFEFPGACAGCGETPYLKLVSQLFGDRMVVANATGCSSIYGGNLPTTPWSVNSEGRGPAWANSLFEDNAEFGLGMRLAADHQLAAARRLLDRLRGPVGHELVDALLSAPQRTEYDIRQQRARVAELESRLAAIDDPLARQLAVIAGQLVRRSVWIIGGDGWAYDIGSGGLDHVLASGRDVNVLVLDTEVYSNTGGQASKSTPLGAVAKFASAGKTTEKKDLALQAMAYGSVYVARIAMGANPQQTLDAMREAEAYEGPSLILAYSHCIAHGIDMRHGLDQQSRAVHSGYWPLVRYNPELRAGGDPPFTLDSVRPTMPFRSYAEQELRYRMLLLSDPPRGEALLRSAQDAVDRKWKQYEDLAHLR